MTELYTYPGHPDVINARGDSEDERERALSNFAEYPFKLAGLEFKNVEAFVQGIKFPEDSPERYHVFGLGAKEAKSYSPRPAPDYIEWVGQKHQFQSLEHFRLQAAAIFAKFNQNQDANVALLRTGELPIIHDLGHPERSDTCLPAAVFSQILRETRQFYFEELGADVDIWSRIYVTNDVIAYARGQSDSLFG